MAEQLRTRHLCITLNPGQRTLNLSEGDTTNVHKAHLDSTDPPDPPPSGVLNGKTPQAAGFCFCGVSLPPPHRGRSPDWPKFKKLTVRKSGIQARHLYISARKRSGLLFDHPLFDRHARNFRQKLAHAQIPHLRLKFELHLPT